MMPSERRNDFENPKYWAMLFVPIQMPTKSGSLSYDEFSSTSDDYPRWDGGRRIRLAIG